MAAERPGSKESWVEDKAAQIALRTIIDCHVPGLGLKAGGHHFVDIWARDELLALPGILRSGQGQMAEEAILALLRYQRADGLIPFRIQRSPSSLAKYKGRPTYFETPRANFRSRMNWGVGYVLDSGLLATIDTADLFRVTGNGDFVQSVTPSLKRSLSWYISHFGDRLISEWPYSEYADATAKFGRVLYTNVLYARALFDQSYLTKEASLLHRADLIREKINRTFWNGDFFADWYDYKRHDHFATHANLLAVILEVADQQQAEKILSFAKEHLLADFTLETNYPAYPMRRLPLHHHLFGMIDYHNYQGMLWLEPGILYSLALAKIGREEEARQMLEKLAQKIIEYGQVFEVYERSGEPVKRGFYEAEHPFLRSAGLYLQALRRLSGQL